MHRNGSRPIALRSWIVYYACLIHLTWSFTLFTSDQVTNVAPVFQVAQWLNSNSIATGLLYLLAAVMAWWGAYHHKFHLLGLVLGMPQLVLVFMGTGACIDVMLHEVHPDGTENSHLFFLAQLAGSLWLAPVYMGAVYGPYWKSIWRKK